MFFALIGALLGFGFLALTVKGPNSSSDPTGFGLIALGLAVVGGGALVGFSVGLALMPRLIAKPSLQITNVLFAFVGFAALAYGLRFWMGLHREAENAVVEAHARDEAHKAEMTRSEQSYLNRARRDVPSLFGELYYPGSEILSDGVAEPDYPRVVLRVHDRPSVVRAYYEPRVTDSKFEGNVLRGHAVRPGDGKNLYFSVEGAYVTFVRPIEDAPAPKSSGPAQAPDPAAALAKDPSWVPASSVAELSEAYGNLLYPGARTNFPSTTPPHPDVKGSMAVLATTDSFETVETFYRGLISVQVDKPDKIVGTVTRADGHPAFVSVERTEPYTYVSFSAS